MAERKDPVLTDTARALIRTMAIDGAATNRLRSALRTQEGVWYRDETIIAAALEFGLTVQKSHVTHEERRVMVWDTGPRRVEDKVRLVPKGTYPVRGFTMLRGGK